MCDWNVNRKSNKTPKHLSKIKFIEWWCELNYKNTKVKIKVNDFND